MRRGPDTPDWDGSYYKCKATYVQSTACSKTFSYCSYFSEAEESTAELLRFKYWKFVGRPPSWIWSKVDFTIPWPPGTHQLSANSDSLRLSYWWLNDFPAHFPRTTVVLRGAWTELYHIRWGNRTIKGPCQFRFGFLTCCSLSKPDPFKCHIFTFWPLP